MRVISFKAFTVLTVCVAMVTVCALPAEAAWGFNLGIRNIKAGEFFEVKGFVAQEDAGVSYNVTRYSGPYFDVLLMDKENFEIYKSGSSAFTYLPASTLHSDHIYADTGVGGLTTGTEYHLVIDNTDRPSGGANPNDYPPFSSSELQVSFIFGAVNIQPLFDIGLIIIVVVVAIVAVAAIVALFLILRSREKSKAPQQQMQYGQQLQQPWMKACPNCGMQVPAEFTYCPRCGNRY